MKESLGAVLLACSLILILSSTSPDMLARAQQGAPRDEQRRFLDVRRRQIELKSARTSLQRTRELFEQGLVARTDLDRAQIVVDTAQLNYQESVLSLLSLKPRLSVREAMKYQGRDGRNFVRLTVANLTPTFDDAQFQVLSNFEGADPIPESLRTHDIRDVFISLRAVGGPKSDDGSIPRGVTIALPYEVHIAELQYGVSKTMEFQLLRDVNSVVVASAYKGQDQETTVQLQREETEDVIDISTMQISQEADLGLQATYDLKLERSSVDVRQFRLKVVNLPHQVNTSFIDRESRARLSQLNFPAGVTQQDLRLRLFLPERADEQVRVDSSLEFWVLAMEEAQAQRFQEERIYTTEEIEESHAGSIRLVIIPRGVGKIEVSAQANLWGTSALVLFLLFVVVGIVVFGIKLTRR